MSWDFMHELRKARAHSHGLRAQLQHGMELLTDDHELCQWDGPLLPLEDIDKNRMIRHGTTGGYRQHYRWNIPACDPCKRAHADENARYRNTRRKAS